MSEELKPCPFCGSEAVLGSSGGQSEVDGYRRAHTVTCKGCGIYKLTFSKPYEGPPEAEAIIAVISAWNTRSNTSQARLSEAVKVLESVVNEEYVPVHVGYDDGPGGGNFVYANAVRVDSDAFIKAKAFIATLGEEK